MHWILHENLFNEKEWDNLLTTLQKFNLSHSVHKVIPFIGELIPEPVITEKKVICIGAYSMRRTAKKNNWTPGVYDLFDQNFQIQLEHWGEHLLNHDSKVVKFKDAYIDDYTFIRPIDDSRKIFLSIFKELPLNVERLGS